MSGRMPVLVLDVGWDGWSRRFSLLEPFRQPLEPLVDGVSTNIPPFAFNLLLQFSPGYDDWPAEKVVDHLQVDFTPVYENTEALPGCCHRVDQMKLIPGKFFHFGFR